MFFLLVASLENFSETRFARHCFLFGHDRTKTLPKKTLMREIAQFSTCFKRNSVAN